MTTNASPHALRPFKRGESRWIPGLAVFAVAAYVSTPALAAEPQPSASTTRSYDGPGAVAVALCTPDVPAAGEPQAARSTDQADQADGAPVLPLVDSPTTLAQSTALQPYRRRFRSPEHRRRYMRRHQTKPGATPMFMRDPVIDGTLISVTFGFALLTEAVIFTGELPPGPPGDVDNLLFLDRPVARAEAPARGASLASDILWGGTVAYAIVDSIRTGKREGRTHGWTDWVMYVEAFSVNFAVADLTKLAVRRPRPVAYQEVRETGELSEETGRSLSFYSLHTAGTASFAATATYLAYARDTSPLQKGLTLSLGIAATGGVALSRVLALQHFPTDVIAGAAIGIGVGVIVPHLHRIDRGHRFRVMPVAGRSQFGLSLGGKM